MNEWWNVLTVDQQIFAAIALTGSLALALQLLLMLIGLDHGDLATGDADVSGAGEHTSGLAFLSIRTLIALAVGFGWTGLALSRNGSGLTLAVGAGLVVGGVLMATVFGIMRTMMRLGCSGSLDYRNAIGLTGDVYATIPASRTGPGQVEVLLQGRLCTAPAMTTCATALTPRSKVKVVDLVDRTTLLVEPLA